MYLMGSFIPHPMGREMVETLFKEEGREKVINNKLEKQLNLIRQREQLRLDSILSSIWCRNRGKQKMKMFKYGIVKI